MRVEAGSILVVEDSEVQRRHTVALCRAAGLQVVYEACNGVEALELLAMLVLPPDLMIVDLEMPGMDGAELIEALERRNAGIPVVIASSREDSLIQAVETLGTALGLRVLAALQKPLRRADIDAALGQLGEVPKGGGGARAEAEPDWTPEDLRQAIAAGEIRVEYQPKVDIRSGIVRGVEALARWTHPRAGRVPPDRFVAVAEKAGLILALTLSVMEQALRQASAWNSRGLRVGVAVNVSAPLLESPRFADTVAWLAERHGLPPGQVVLELTESAVVSRLGAALSALVRLRLKGFGLSIDDYGTGFSSMQQLARLPFTELKIDRSFVHGAHRRNNLRVILKSALDMARQLGVASVAEGVETMADWRLLQDLGCSVGQGYLIARPMAAEAFPAWLREHQLRIPELRGGRHAPPPVAVAG